MTKGLPMPVYDVQNVGGQPHQRVFTIGVKVGSLAMTGEGTSKKDSKREAAEKMYEKLKVRKIRHFTFALRLFLFKIQSKKKKAHTAIRRVCNFMLKPSLKFQILIYPQFTNLYVQLNTFSLGAWPGSTAHDQRRW